MANDTTKNSNPTGKKKKATVRNRREWYHHRLPYVVYY